MVIVWDEPKRLTNIRTHGLDFADVGDGFEWDDAFLMETHPGSRGEPRFMAIGFLADDLVTLVFSRLGSEGISLISLRWASRKERRAYAER